MWSVKQILALFPAPWRSVDNAELGADSSSSASRNQTRRPHRAAAFRRGGFKFLQSLRQIPRETRRPKGAATLIAAVFIFSGWGTIDPTAGRYAFEATPARRPAAAPATGRERGSTRAHPRAPTRTSTRADSGKGIDSPGAKECVIKRHAQTASHSKLHPPSPRHAGKDGPGWRQHVTASAVVRETAHAHVPPSPPRHAWHLQIESGSKITDGGTTRYAVISSL